MKGYVGIGVGVGETYEMEVEELQGCFKRKQSKVLKPSEIGAEHRAACMTTRVHECKRGKSRDRENDDGLREEGGEPAPRDNHLPQNRAIIGRPTHERASRKREEVVQSGQ